VWLVSLLSLYWTTCPYPHDIMSTDSPRLTHSEHPNWSHMHVSLSLAFIFKKQKQLLLVVIETSNYCNRNQLQHEMELQIGVVEEMQNDIQWMNEWVSEQKRERKRKYNCVDYKSLYEGSYDMLKHKHKRFARYWFISGI
jgi:hypothetical protein